jgi:hypothetical protein
MDGTRGESAIRRPGDPVATKGIKVSQEKEERVQ